MIDYKAKYLKLMTIYHKLHEKLSRLTMIFGDAKLTKDGIKILTDQINQCSKEIQDIDEEFRQLVRSR